MIRLICSKCSKAWYTANTNPSQKCTDCGGLLMKDTLFSSAKQHTKGKIDKDPKIIHLEDYLGVTV